MSWAKELWLLSLLLVVIAFMIVVVLVAARVVGALLRRSREAERATLLTLLLGEAEPPVTWSPTRRRQAAELSVELIQLVRGKDREAFIDRAMRLGVPELLRHRLDSGSARVRVAAAEALTQFHDNRSMLRLEAALEDRNSDVRLIAALALAAADRAPPARELIDKLGIGETEHSRLSVSLFRELAKQRPDEIQAVITDPTVPAGARAAAIEAVSASFNYALVPSISDAIMSSPPDAAELPRYLRALAEFGHPAAEPAVRHALASASWEARAAAARTAGQIGLVSLAQPLQQLLADPEWWVRFRAGEALARLGEAGLARLRASAGSATDPERSAAALTLAERGLA